MGGGESLGVVSDLWRYPVKSFGGERVRAAFAGPFGVLGDRRHALLDAAGAPMSARRHHALLGYRARYLDPDAADQVEVTTPDESVHAWDDPALAERLGEEFGQDIHMVRSPASVHDAAPVHIITTASLGAASDWTPGEEMDVRRFRPNVVIDMDGLDAFTEAAWPGLSVEVGDDGPALMIVSPTERCAVTTFDPDTLERDNRVLKGLAADRENLFGVYAVVSRPGWLRVGAEVRITRSAA